METLPTTLKPTIDGTSLTTETNTIETKFANGYSQRCGNGINSVKQTWNTEWKGEKTAVMEYYNFFVARAGHEAFYWTPPWNDTPLMFVCRGWGQSILNGKENEGSVGIITGEFEQVFDLV